MVKVIDVIFSQWLCTGGVGFVWSEWRRRRALIAFRFACKWLYHGMVGCPTNGRSHSRSSAQAITLSGMKSKLSISVQESRKTKSKTLIWSMLFKSADKSRFFWVILGISSTVAERKKPNFCEEKREKKFFRKQAAAAPSLWTLTPNYSARERRGSRTSRHPWHFRWKTIKEKSGETKQRNGTKEKKSNNRIRGGNSDPAPPGNASTIALLTILTINFVFEPLRRRTELLRVIMHHFGAFRERRTVDLPSFQSRVWVPNIKCGQLGQYKM